jgi:methionyl-tRNA formyltransferase
MFILHIINRYVLLSKRSYSTSINKPLNIAFFGSDLFSMHILEHLYRLFHNDKSRIKHLEVITTVSSINTVMQGAEKLQLKTHTWSNTETFISNSSVQFDLGILASFGQLLPKRLIESFPLYVELLLRITKKFFAFYSRGIINIHPSLLPRWRGSSPLIYTIANGDLIGGVSIMDIRPKQ